MQDHLIVQPGLVQEDHCLPQIGGALRRLAQSGSSVSSLQGPPHQTPPEPRRSRTRCGSMAVPPAGTRRTSRSSCAGAASAQGLSGQLLRKTEPKTSHHPARAGIAYSIGRCLQHSLHLTVNGGIILFEALLFFLCPPILRSRSDILPDRWTSYKLPHRLHHSCHIVS